MRSFLTSQGDTSWRVQAIELTLPQLLCTVFRYLFAI